MLRGNNYYTDFEEEVEYVEKLFKTEEITPSEQSIVNNLERQKEAITNQIALKEKQIENLQKEIEKLKQSIEAIEKRIAGYQLT